MSGVPTPRSHDRFILAGGLLAMVAATLVHEPLWLAGALAGLLALAGAARWAVLRRAVRVVLPVNLMISAGMVLAGWLAGRVDWAFLLLLNLRVVLLASLAAWLAVRVNFDRALAPWPAARRGLAIIRVQSALLRRLALDYRLAFASRSIQAPTLVNRYRAVSAHGLGLLDKAVANAEATTLAMRSRGAMDE